MNKVWETGRLTMEPNVCYNSVKNADGKTEERVVASYNLAVTRSYNQQTADFFRCIAFGKTLNSSKNICTKEQKFQFVDTCSLEIILTKMGSDDTPLKLSLNSTSLQKAVVISSQKRHQII